MKVFYILSALMFSFFVTQGQTSIYGKITDEISGEEIQYANIVFYKKGIYSNKDKTDVNGNFIITVDPGKYDMKIIHIGYPDNIIKNLIVASSQITKLNLALVGSCFSGTIVKDYKIPLIKIDNTSTSQTILSKDIQKEPHKNILQLIQSMPGISINNL